ncbi:hypothetical protein GCM10009118_07980 [Wandonia haliotis]|uniref:Coiled-coil protein n=1 Tax=Wandonia haliotis TaxID=574963 RepID=A0ABN1MMD0_9FLAO
MNSEQAKKLTEMKNLHNEIKRQAKEYLCFCSHCDQKSIDSHSISESRVLGALVKDRSEKLFVLEDESSPDYEIGKMSTFQARNRKLIERHIASASTFRGFCGPHDTEFFEELDRKLYQNTLKINFLHALRAYAYKLCKEKCEFQFIDEKLSNILGESLRLWDDKVTPHISHLKAIVNNCPDDVELTWEQAEPIINEHLKKMEGFSALGIDTNTPEYINAISFLPTQEADYPIEMRELKKVLSSSLDTADNYMATLKSSEHSKAFDTITEYASEVLKHQEDTKYELTKCLTEELYDEFLTETFSIEGIHKIAGNFIYYTPKNEEIVLTFFPEEETSKTWFIFTAWQPSQTQRVYLSKLKLMEPIKFSQFVSNIILSQGTNTYLSGEFFESLPDKQKTILSQVKTLQAFLSFDLFNRP